MCFTSKVFKKGRLTPTPVMGQATLGAISPRSSICSSSSSGSAAPLPSAAATLASNSCRTSSSSASGLRKRHSAQMTLKGEALFCSMSRPPLPTVAPLASETRSTSSSSTSGLAQKGHSHLKLLDLLPNGCLFWCTCPAATLVSASRSTLSLPCRACTEIQPCDPTKARLFIREQPCFGSAVLPTSPITSNSRSNASSTSRTCSQKQPMDGGRAEAERAVGQVAVQLLPPMNPHVV